MCSGKRLTFELRLASAMPQLDGLGKGRPLQKFRFLLRLPRPLHSTCNVWQRRLWCLEQERGRELRSRLKALSQSDWGKPQDLIVRLLTTPTDQNRSNSKQDATAVASKSCSALFADWFGRSMSRRQLLRPSSAPSVRAPRVLFATSMFDATQKGLNTSAFEPNASGIVLRANPKNWSRESNMRGSAATPGAQRCTKRGIEIGDGCRGHHCFLGRCLCSRRGDAAIPCVGRPSAERDAQVTAFCESLPISCELRQCAQANALVQLKEWHHHRIHQGFTLHDAMQLFHKLHEDTCTFYDDQWGVVSIDTNRWRRAQSFEVAHQVGVDADREDLHVKRFNGYAALHGLDLGDVLEIGSGPFAQTLPLLRMAEARTRSITLVDPLMSNYVLMPRCRFKMGSLDSHPVQLVQSGGEDLDFDGTFDTVIMMNVLEHCLHGLRVLQNMHDALKPGGRLIFSERSYDQHWANLWKSKERLPFWDVGHPISLRRATFDMLLAHYTPLYELSDPEDGYYFIGIKTGA
jgi:SAM-dependent methyltransferase